MNEGAAKSVTYQAAQAAVVESAKALASEEVSLRDALGRVVRQDLVCDSDYPPSDVSAMDGYALASAGVASASRERPVWLKVVGTVKAGGLARMSPGKGECVAVTTGACVPEGADAVVPQEDAEVRGDSIVVSKPSPAGGFIRKKGEIARRGDRLDLKGRRASPQVLGLAAAFGAETFAVARRPRVGVLATGDELAAVGERPDGRHVRASNLAMLLSLARLSGCEVLDAGLSSDSSGDIVEHLEACAGCDAVVMSGGVSGGAFDLVPDALHALGADVKFRGLRMQPGKRTIFGVKEDTLFFGLPGNPSAAFVAFHTIVRPGLLAMQGCLEPREVLCLGHTASALEKTMGETHTLFLPARIVGSWAGDGLEVEPVRMRGRGDVIALAEATCLIRLDDDIHSVEAGDKVEVIVLPGATWT